MTLYLRRHLAVVIAAFLGVALPLSARAGAIAFDHFLEFGLDGAGPAAGCAPDDPGGTICIPSFGTATDFLDAPPWTFTALNGATLIVTDAFEAGDRFEVLDFGSSIGSTSVPIGTADCGDDPVPCLADPNISKGTFALAPGNHSITINSLTDSLGSGYLKVSAVPEADCAWVLAAGAVAVLILSGRRVRASKS